jgi:hypothetical protein
MGFPARPLTAHFITNRVVDVDAAKDRQIETDTRADALTRLLHQAAKQNKLLSITLDSRKWYVGYVAEAPSLNPEEKYFRLLPIMSGYRDKDTLETFRTVFYEEVLGTKSSADFIVTLPIADVKTATFFDVDIYEAHFAEDTGAEGFGDDEELGEELTDETTS